MPKPAESKHQRFLRLMQRRLERALEELRLISQLSSDNYENTPEEAAEAVSHLDRAVVHIAASFDVPYATATGKYAEAVKQAGFMKASKAKDSFNEMDIAKAIDLLNQNKVQEAKFLLKNALLQDTAA